MPRITVKWGAKKLEVDASTELEPLVLKSQLYELTGVLPDRQKVIIKGKQLSDESWGELTLQEGATIMMMGTAPAAPAPTSTEVGGKPAAAAAATSPAANGSSAAKSGGSGGEEKEVLPQLPVGLKNLGNTCYMNASLQAYRAIPELCSALKALTPAAAGAQRASERDRMLAFVVNRLFTEMDNKLAVEAARSNAGGGEQGEKVITPFVMLSALHTAFPQFTTRDDHGHFQQQDANECFAEVLRILGQLLTIKMPGESTLREPTAPTPLQPAGAAASQPPATGNSVGAARLFECEFRVEWKCLEKLAATEASTEPEPMDVGEKPAAASQESKESDQKPPPQPATQAVAAKEASVEDVTNESHLQLSCFLDQEVKYLQLGIKSKMTEVVEKASAALGGRNAKYEKKSMLQRLPAYLCIQMVRFFYKEKIAMNAKVLKDVKFPINLDVHELCTPELKERLQVMRDRYKLFDDDQQEAMRRAKQDVDGSRGSSKAAVAQVAAGALKGPFEATSFADDAGSNNSGLYELKAVITHKGRSSNSGHYVAWVRINGQGPHWAMCDDDEVHPVSEEDVLKLSGGGDWHCAYVLVYGPKPLPLGGGLPPAAAAEGVAEKKNPLSN